MASNIKLHIIIRWLIASVWLINGLFCKVVNMVPRHTQIVAAILGGEHARLLTILIGIAETCMAVWIITNPNQKFNAIVQSIIIATMNVLEFLLVPQLLLWGRLNIVFAFLFIVVILYNEFMLKNKPAE